MISIQYIHQIELTTRCNLACIYCPHPKMERKKVDMEEAVFHRSLEWVKYFNNREQQKELALTGIGEALLHPNFIAMTKLARKYYDGFIHFSTNGLLFDDNVASFCKDYAIGVFISMHRPEKGVPAQRLAEKYGVLAGTNTAFIDSALNWAGTVDWHVSAPESVCKYQKDGWGVVMVDGSITTCCMDSEGTNILGHVDDPIGTVDMVPKPLCANCNLKIEDVA